MNKISFYISCILMIMQLTACEKELDHSGLENINPKLVLNTLLTAGAERNSLHITRSRSVFDRLPGWYEEPFSVQKDAEVNVTVNGERYAASYSDQNSTYLLKHTLQAGDRVDVEASWRGDKVISSVIIPSAPQVISVDTASFERIKYGYIKQYLRFQVKIKDPSGVRNFYRLRLDGVISDSWYGNMNISSWMRIESEDPVLTNGFVSGIEDSDIELENFPRNDFTIFTDNLFEGDEYTLNFYVDKLSSSTFFDSYYYTISIQSITEDLYHYYYSVLKAKYIDETMNEPVLVFNNIEGGIGIAGGVNEQEIFYDEYNNEQER